MNIKFIALLSFSFATGINSMSPFDQYENTRKEFIKCRDSWSALLGCSDQISAFNEAKNQLVRPFNEVIEEAKDGDKILSDIAYQCDRENLLISSVRKKYLKEEEVYGLNSVRHYIAQIMVRKIQLDNPRPVGILLSDYMDNDDRPSIETQIMDKIKEIKEPNYYLTRDRFADERAMTHRNILYRTNHINLLLRPSNTTIINQAVEEAEKSICQLSTKK
jgi:hypothetical protein